MGRGTGGSNPSRSMQGSTIQNPQRTPERIKTAEYRVVTVMYRIENALLEVFAHTDQNNVTLKAGIYSHTESNLNKKLQQANKIALQYNTEKSPSKRQEKLKILQRELDDATYTIKIPSSQS